MALLTLEIGQILHQPAGPILVQFHSKNPKPEDEDMREGLWCCLALAYYQVWVLIVMLYQNRGQVFSSHIAPLTAREVQQEKGRDR